MKRIQKTFYSLCSDGFISYPQKLPNTPFLPPDTKQFYKRSLLNNLNNKINSIFVLYIRFSPIINNISTYYFNNPDFSFWLYKTQKIWNHKLSIQTVS